MPKVNMSRQAGAAQGMTADQSAAQTAAAAQEKTQAAQTDNRPENHLLKVLDFLVNGIQFENAAEKQKGQQDSEAMSKQRDEGQQNLVGVDKQQDLQDAKDREAEERATGAKEQEKDVREDNRQTNETGKQIEIDRVASQTDDDRLRQERLKASGAVDELDRGRREQLNQTQTREEQQLAESRARQTAEAEESRARAAQEQAEEE